VRLSNNQAWTLFFVGLGYLGAAIFYSYLIGIDAQTQIACPVCPHILRFASIPPIHQFVSRVLVLGTVNALFFLLIGWLLISLVRFIRRSTAN